MKVIPGLSDIQVLHRCEYKIKSRQKGTIDKALPTHIGQKVWSNTFGPNILSTFPSYITGSYQYQLPSVSRSAINEWIGFQ